MRKNFIKKMFVFGAMLTTFSFTVSVNAATFEYTVSENGEYVEVAEDEYTEVADYNEKAEIENVDATQLATPVLEWDTSGYTLKVKWKKISNATSGYDYEVYKDGIIVTSSKFISTKVSHSIGNILESNGEGVYTVKLRCKETSSYAASEWAELEYVYKIPENKLAAPKNVQWSESEFGTITWNAVEDATGYNVVLFCDGDRVMGFNGSFSDCQLNFVELGYIKENGNHTVKVRATSGDPNKYSTSDEACSDNLSVTLATRKLNSPSNLKWDETTLTWDAVDGACSYNYEIYKNGDRVRGSIGITHCYLDLASTFSSYGNGVYTVELSAISADPTKYLNSDYAISPEYIYGDSGNSEVTEEQKALVEAFVRRMYTEALNREYDEAGCTYWTNALLDGSKDGVTVARQFLTSNELVAQNLSNEEFISRLYATFFDREEPTTSTGFKFWMNYLENGVSRKFVIRGFAHSAEFTAVCNNYGITRGNMVLTDNSDQNANVTMYVFRCYDRVLGRTPDASGLNYWTGEINKKTKNPIKVAEQVVFSKEFLAKNVDNDTYIRILYNMFFDREADANGLKFWLEEMNSGRRDRYKVLTQFANSAEFQAVLKTFGW